MNWLQAALAVVLITGAILGWMIWHRRISGGDTPLIGATKRRARDQETDNELEAFIAQYRSGKLDPVALTDGDETSLDSATIGTTGSTARSEAPAQSAPAHAAPARGTLLRPEVKLAYLTLRSGLRDHHIFANVRLGDLGFGTAVGIVDLLVCAPDFKYVAAIDVGVGELPEDIPKTTFLNRAGLKHLKLTSRAMPKPVQLRDLIYGQMQT